MQLFIASGVTCSLAGIIFTARLSNARADNALGFELDVITIVLLGGISVFGGKGIDQAPAVRIFELAFELLRRPKASLKFNLIQTFSQKNCR